MLTVSRTETLSRFRRLHAASPRRTATVDQHPFINVLAVAMGISLLITAIALVLPAVALAVSSWRTSAAPTVVAATDWWRTLLAFGRDVEWSAVIGTLAAVAAVLAAAYGSRATHTQPMERWVSDWSDDGAPSAWLGPQPKSSLPGRGTSGATLDVIRSAFK